MMRVKRCADCRTILQYEVADGRWIAVDHPRHTCKPPRKEMWRIERDPYGTPVRMWWNG